MQIKIIALMNSDNFISVKSVAEQTGTLQRTVEYNIKKLRDLGIIVRHGGARYGYWELKE